MWFWRGNIKGCHENMASRAVVRLMYSEVGSPSTYRTPLVVLHGLFGSKLNWKTLSMNMSRDLDRKVFVLDARNHGESPHCDHMNYDVMSRDTVNFCQEKRITKAILIGHSMGGKTAMVTALKHPDLVEKLVVVDVTPREAPDIRGSEELIKTLTKVDTSGLKNRQEADEILEKEIPDLTLRQFLLTNLVKHKGELRWRVNLPAIKACMRLLKGFPDFTSAYRAPTLFIGGGDSNYIRSGDETEIKRLFPNSQVAYIPRAGHWLHYQKPEAFRKLVTEFVQS